MHPRVERNPAGVAWRGPRLRAAPLRALHLRLAVAAAPGPLQALLPRRESPAGDGRGARAQAVRQPAVTADLFWTRLVTLVTPRVLLKPAAHCAPSAQPLVPPGVPRGPGGRMGPWGLTSTPCGPLATLPRSRRPAPPRRL